MSSGRRSTAENASRLCSSSTRPHPQGANSRKEERDCRQFSDGGGPRVHISGPSGHGKETRGAFSDGIHHNVYFDPHPEMVRVLNVIKAEVYEHNVLQDSRYDVH